MTPLKDLILAAAEFDPALWDQHHDSQVARIKDEGLPTNFVCDYHKGLRKENARLTPLIEALADVASAADEARRNNLEYDKFMDSDVDLTREQEDLAHFAINNIVEAEQRMDQALTRLREKVGGG